VFNALHRLDLRSSTGDADRARWAALCARSIGLSGEADDAAKGIIEAVLQDGDAAIIELTRRFESRELTAPEFEIPRDRCEAAWVDCDASLRAALNSAAERVERFHRTQVPTTTGTDEDGSRLRSRVEPLRRVAVYAPGGTAAYPSSVLMTAIPAKVAGVDEVILFTPRPSPVVLAAAHRAGVDPARMRDW
jgi:histidinol dehydrogenase